MAKPRVLVFSGYGLNCEEETKFAFDRAGAAVDIAHINDIIDGHKKLTDYQIAAFPGGFSYGDDLGSGLAYANRIRNNIWEQMMEFVNRDTLTIGICNGFQIIANLGLAPALDRQYGTVQAALTHNDSARYICRWTDVQFESSSPWTQNLGMLPIPIAHGEGKFYAPPEIMAEIKKRGLVAARYVKGEMCAYQGLSANPTGTLDDIAGITDDTGRVLGMMPHPERAMFFTQLPNWPLLKEQLRRQGKPIPEEGPGLKILQNGVRYFG